MKLHKYWVMLMAAAAALIETYPVVAQVDDTANTLPGPGIFGLVMLGIAAAVGIARWRK